MKISSATAVVHTTTNFKSPYMMYGWVELKLNQRISVPYAVDSGVNYHKLILLPFYKDDMILVLEKGTPTSIADSYESLITHFVTDKVDIDSVIRKILA